MSCVTNRIDIPRSRWSVAHQVFEVGPCLRVDRGERLVHDEHLGLIGDGAGDRDALLHAAGELPRVALGRVVEPDGVRASSISRSRSARESFLCLSGSSTFPRTVSHGYRLRPYSWKTSAILAGGAGHRLAVELDDARGGPEQAGDALQQSRLAASGRSDDADELAGAHPEADVADRLDVPRRGLVDLAQVLDVQQRGARSIQARSTSLIPWYQRRTRRSTNPKIVASSTPIEPEQQDAAPHLGDEVVALEVDDPEAEPGRRANISEIDHQDERDRQRLAHARP